MRTPRFCFAFFVVLHLLYPALLGKARGRWKNNTVPFGRCLWGTAGALFFASLCLACQGVKAGPAVLAAKGYGTGGLSMCEQMAAGILITAPLGAVLMDKTYRRLLRRNADSDTFGE